ncbi:Sec61p translocation complex subunit [Aspergillus nanangensis]|uniref:Sec61p translocation complex subunit n=1 Tax=Aspergillus nanangensis TaxID=2582783 RepID=A0AAD4CYP6_ASPNN|nr:Sec61p translocation complex subunit [Aspergillus nanangensis]
MADQVQELLNVPREFLKEGMQFINRSQKPDRREFIKISQAVGVGFLVMGSIGFIVKLVHIPVNNVLVGAA